MFFPRLAWYCPGSSNTYHIGSNSRRQPASSRNKSRYYISISHSVSSSLHVLHVVSEAWNLTNANLLPSSFLYWWQHQVQQPLMCGYQDRHTSPPLHQSTRTTCSSITFEMFGFHLQCAFCILNTVAVYKWLFWLFSEGSSVIYTLNIIQSVL